MGYIFSTRRDVMTCFSILQLGWKKFWNEDLPVEVLTWKGVREVMIHPQTAEKAAGCAIVAYQGATGRSQPYN